MISLRTTVTLIRLEESDQGTFGVLLIDGQVFCVTLEPSDNENARNISSIPAQQYTCIRYNSPNYKDTFKVCNVPGRDGILFHWGNHIEDTEGCILLGKYYDADGAFRGIMRSARTHKEFMAIMKDVKEFNLTIREVY